jgi:hypothetical protein
MFGDTHDLHATEGDFLKNTWLLDVARLPAIPAPTTAKNPSRLRATGMHYADVSVQGNKANVIIHSKPVEIKLLNLAKIADEQFTTDFFSGEFDGYRRYGNSDRDDLHLIEHILHPGLKMAVLFDPDMDQWRHL